MMEDEMSYHDLELNCVRCGANLFKAGCTLDGLLKTNLCHACEVSSAAATMGRKGGQARSDAKTKAVRENAKRSRSNRKTGYRVWLFGDSYWHKTLEGAKKRIRDAYGWCNGEHNLIVEVATGREVSWIPDDDE